jgi:hypothetical protein
MQWNTEERESGNDLFSAWDGTQKKGNLEMACTETQFFVWDSSEFTRLERSRTFACFPDLHCVILSCIIAACLQFMWPGAVTLHHPGLPRWEPVLLRGVWPLTPMNL